MTRIKKKVVSSKTKVSRRILCSLSEESEEEAVATVLRAMKEPALKGDIRVLIKKIQ